MYIIRLGGNQVVTGKIMYGVKKRDETTCLIKVYKRFSEEM